jgi:hypothetical protein
VVKYRMPSSGSTATDPISPWRAGSGNLHKALSGVSA